MKHCVMYWIIQRQITHTYIRTVEQRERANEKKWEGDRDILEKENEIILGFCMYHIRNMLFQQCNWCALCVIFVSLSQIHGKHFRSGRASTHLYKLVSLDIYIYCLHLIHIHKWFLSLCWHLVFIGVFWPLCMENDSWVLFRSSSILVDDDYFSFGRFIHSVFEWRQKKTTQYFFPFRFALLCSLYSMKMLWSLFAVHTGVCVHINTSSWFVLFMMLESFRFLRIVISLFEWRNSRKSDFFYLEILLFYRFVFFFK